ncbi:MAG: glutaredoxin family protein [Gammaproteobacteria bacterium]|nr:MAG: glutaredoxin family protein [Gammaproteobacteria bacterium]
MHGTNPANASPSSGCTPLRFIHVFCLALLLGLAAGMPVSHAEPGTAPSGQVQSSGPKVYMFSSAACIYCYVARKTFDRYGIDYEEFDISTSDAARTYFNRLGGRGTPLIVVNGKRMHGFDEKRFWALYGERPEPVSLTDKKAGNDQPK